MGAGNRSGEVGGACGGGGVGGRGGQRKGNRRSGRRWPTAVGGLEVQAWDCSHVASGKWRVWLGRNLVHPGRALPPGASGLGPSAFLISCGAGLVYVKLSLKPLLPGPGGHLGLERSSRKNARRGPLWPGGIKRDIYRGPWTEQGGENAAAPGVLFSWRPLSEDRV